VRVRAVRAVRAGQLWSTHRLLQLPLGGVTLGHMNHLNAARTTPLSPSCNDAPHVSLLPFASYTHTHTVTAPSRAMAAASAVWACGRHTQPACGFVTVLAHGARCVGSPARCAGMKDVQGVLAAAA
jgi:hypothetical protein